LCGQLLVFNFAARFEAAEQRTVVAHGETVGTHWQNDSSPGRGGRNGLLNGDFLSLLPELGGCVGD
jgi:hypothetical protein